MNENYSVRVKGSGPSDPTPVTISRGLLAHLLSCAFAWHDSRQLLRRGGGEDSTLLAALAALRPPHIAPEEIRTSSRITGAVNEGGRISLGYAADDGENH